MEPALFVFKDYVYLVGLALTAGTFVWKLQADSRSARFRETVSFIEKREKEMRERWRRITQEPVAEGGVEDEIYVLTGQLELVSLLMHLGAFDEEIVYNYWWRYFEEPLKNAQINTWVMVAREDDATVLQHYVKQCRMWSGRLDRELGRAKRPVLKRWFSRLWRQDAEGRTAA